MNCFKTANNSSIWTLYKISKISQRQKNTVFALFLYRECCRDSKEWPNKYVIGLNGIE